jgi:ribosomal protein S12 methylthiotransferase accessory factor YcaO
MTKTFIHYTLHLLATSSGAGFFACRPEVPRSFEAQLAYLKHHPNDEFMRKELLLKIAALEKKEFKKRLKSACRTDRLLHSLLGEAVLLYEKFSGLQSLFTPRQFCELSTLSPLIYLPSACREDQQNHFEWIKRFRSNLFYHQPLSPSHQTGLPPLFTSEELLRQKSDWINIEDITTATDSPSSPQASGETGIPPSETALKAIQRLEQIDSFIDIEKRHEASLSPIGLLRSWRLRRSIENRRHHYILQGSQTSYGKGLSLDAARASCLMEIVERHSAFADIKKDHIPGYQQDFPLIRAGFSELAANGINALNPNHLLLEIPYKDDPLYWIEGVRRHTGAYEPIWIPTQCVFLFCNLDEIKLFSSLGSTGLAAGNSMAEAKRSALLEIIERDAENTTPYHPSLCFQATSNNPRLASLLEHYHAMDIHIRFQDLTTPMGIPCCKCFVEGKDGQIHKGTGAHLTAEKALIAALTETPYPFPKGPPSKSLLEKVTIVPLEKLPDYATENAQSDVSLLEQLLEANGFYPVYIHLTRKDLDIPVVKALIPGMELVPDFDRFSRVNPRLYQNYLNLFP